jgi:hypothetical protein
MISIGTGSFQAASSDSRPPVIPWSDGGSSATGNEKQDGASGDHPSAVGDEHFMGPEKEEGKVIKATGRLPK